jgi:hypothetical protein
MLGRAVEVQETANRIQWTCASQLYIHAEPFFFSGCWLLKFDEKPASFQVDFQLVRQDSTDVTKLKLAIELFNCGIQGSMACDQRTGVE